MGFSNAFGLVYALVTVGVLIFSVFKGAGSGRLPPLDKRAHYERQDKRWRDAKEARDARRARKLEYEAMYNQHIEKRAQPPARPLPQLISEQRIQSELNERCKRIGSLIKSRFNATELTATRYRLLIDEVRLGVLSNLARQKDLMASVAHLDQDKVELELTDADVTRKNILAQRLDMLKHVDKRIAELETANEEALHVLDRAIVTLAGTLPLRGGSGAHLDRSVSDLEDMLSQTHRRGAGSIEDEFDIEPTTKKGKDKRIITPGAS